MFQFGTQSPIVNPQIEFEACFFLIRIPDCILLGYLFPPTSRQTANIDRIPFHLFGFTLSPSGSGFVMSSGSAYSNAGASQHQSLSA